MGTRRLLIPAAAIAIFTAIGSVAWAQDVPGVPEVPTVPDTPSAPDVPDGDFTCPPGSTCHLNQTISGNEHEDRAPWTLIGGAEHPTTTVIEDSPTPFDVDLFAVRARNARQVLAGGAVCAEQVSPDQV